MEFASSAFIFFFLPIVVLVFWLLGCLKNGAKLQNIFLCVSNIVFYLYGGVRSFLLFICIIIFNYFAGRLISKIEKAKAFVLLVSIFINVGILSFFKYFDLIKTYINASEKSFAMPLALSFIIFNAISYVVDVYRSGVCCKKFRLFFLYMTLFPKLVQGPVMPYSSLKDSLVHRDFSWDNIYEGLRYFIYGLGKKVIIANTVAQSVDSIWSVQPENLSTLLAWVGIILYTVQIYFDFSGYSDMAIGVGKMLGFNIMQNFNYPYISTSIKEFWSRWHISLSTWFKNYIYIPLGGSKKGKLVQIFAILVVFFVTGLWHGSDLSFIAWGLLFGVFRIIEALLPKQLFESKIYKPFGWLYTNFVVMMSWVLFRADSLNSAISYYGTLFNYHALKTGLPFSSYLSLEVMIAFILSLLSFGWLQTVCKPKKKESKAFYFIETTFLIVVFVVAIILLVGGSYSPSIYGKF